jgi:hypothetical protein
MADSMRPVRQWTDALFAETWSPADLASLTMPVLLLGGEHSPSSAYDPLPKLAGLPVAPGHAKVYAGRWAHRAGDACRSRRPGDCSVLA